MNLPRGRYNIRSNGSQPHFSPNVNLTSSNPGCPFPNGARISLYFAGVNYSFGATDRDQVLAGIYATEGLPSAPIDEIFFNTLDIKRLTLGALSLDLNSSTVRTITCDRCKIGSLFVRSSACTFTGDYELVDNCGGPSRWYLNSSTTTDTHFSMNVNVTDSAIIDLTSLAQGVPFNMNGAFSIQRGVVVVKGGTLDLRNANVTGLDQNRYFITKWNDNNHSQMGAVLLPAVGGIAKKFDLGISIPPNGSNPATTAYAPVGIVSNNSSSNVTISLQVLSAPAGYVGPSIQWAISASGTSPDLMITLTWPAAAESSLFSAHRDLAKIYHFNGTTWDELPTSGLVTNADGSFSLTVSHVTSFSPFMVGFAASALPIELLDFTAKKEGISDAFLNWHTASEQNSNRFEVERSFDGKGWANIASLKSAGTSNEKLSYSYLDRGVQAVDGSAYYRLKLVDDDESFKYSGVQTVHFDGKGVVSRVFPNPAREVVHLRVSGVGGGEETIVVVMDGLGREVLRQLGTGAEQDIRIGGLGQGVYFVRVLSGNRVVMDREKLVVY